MRTFCRYVIAILCLASLANGQRLYRKEMDAAAQQAVKAMEKVGSKELFDRMLANLAIQTKQDYETIFSGIRRQTRDRIQTWDNWCAVHADMTASMFRIGYPGFQDPDLLHTKTEAELKTRCGQLLESGTLSAAPIPAEWTQALTDIAAAKTTLAGQIDALRNPPAGTGDTAAAARIDAVMNQLGNLDEVDGALKQIGDSSFGGKVKSLIGPARLTAAILKDLSGAYQDYQARRADIMNVRDDLREFKVAMLKVAALKLAAQEEHFKRLIAIEERRARELNEAARSFEDYREIILSERTQFPELDLSRIDESLRDAGVRVASERSTPADEYRYATDLNEVLENGGDRVKFYREHPAPPRVRVQRLSRALFLAAAVQARASTPEYLAELRRAQEAQRYSIVLSSVEARAYETLVNTGVQRLAMLHAGGIKPEQIAQLVFQAGQLAGISVIASLQ